MKSNRRSVSVLSSWVLSLALSGCSVFSSSLDGYASGKDAGPTLDAGTGEPGGNPEAGQSPSAFSLQLTPSSYDFGTVVVDKESKVASFQLKNAGTASTKPLFVELGLETNAFDLNVTSDGCSDQSLTPGSTCMFNVEYTPTRLGKLNTILTISDADHPSLATASLTGEGVSEHTLSITPGVTDFGQVLIGDTSPAKDLLLTNTGDEATEVTIDLVASDQGEADSFVLDASGCAGSIPPKASCLIKLTAIPSSRGPVSAQVRAKNANDEVSVVATAVGVKDATLTPSPTSVDFGYLANGTQSEFTIDVVNDGDVVAENIEAGIDDSDNGGEGPFTVESSTCGDSLEPAEHCSVEVRFHPTSVGQYAATLLIKGSPGGESHVALKGAAQTVGLTVTPPSVSYEPVDASSQGQSKPEIQTLYVKNTSSSVSLNSLKIELPPQSPFNLVKGSGGDCSQTQGLGPGMKCMVSVAFEPPLGMEPGSYTAILKATGSGKNLGGGTLSVTATSMLQGTVLVPPMLVISPLNYDFGTVTLGNSTKSRIFQITNIGQVATKTPITASLTGAGATMFEVTGNQCDDKMLKPGESCDLSVSFSPYHTGTYTATIQATDPGLTHPALLTGVCTNKPPSGSEDPSK